MPRSPRVAWVAIALAAAALAVTAAVFVAGIEVPGEFLRAPIERALTAAFKVPVRVEGPLGLRTGFTATVWADALVLADPSGPAGATLARGIRPAARIDLVALLRRVVALQEVTGERLELALVRRDDGRANWAPMLAPAAGGGAAYFRFGGIERLRIGAVSGSYRSGGGAPAPFAIESLQGAVPLREPTAARGSLQVAGQSVAFDLRSAPFADLVGSRAALPVQGTVQWNGARAEVRGALTRDGSRFDAEVQASANDAAVPLAALGLATRQPGHLELRLRLGVTATAATAQDVALTVGGSAASGSASIAWAGPRWRVAADLAGPRVDLGPLEFARSLPRDRTAPEALVELLERTATGIEAEVRLAVDELAGLPVAVRDLRFEGRSGDRNVAGNGSADVAGTRVEARLHYDARRARRILSARLEGGAVSTAALPGRAQPRDVSGRAAGIAGRLQAQGEDARALLGSIEAGLEARDLRWAVGTPKGAAFAGRFDRLRLRVLGRRASSVEAGGQLGAAACALRISGGALAPLLEGAPWPLQIAGACPGGRLNARGRIAVAKRQVTGELEFDAAAARAGPVAQALGVATGLPQPVAARGTLVLDDTRAQARLAALRLGRTMGSGEVAWPLGAGGAGRVRLQLTALDLDELGALAEPGAAAAGPRAREAGQKGLRLPDVDFDVAAGRVAIAGNDLRRLQFGGALRAGRLPPASFGFDWEGIPVSGRLSADFSDAVPRIALDAAAKKADLRALAARLGYAEIRLRADTLTLKASAAGWRLGELLAATTLDAVVEGGQFDLLRRAPPGQSGRGEFSATLVAAPGTPAALAARGTIGGEPLDLTVVASGLAEFAQAETAVPVTVRLALGDARLDGSGTVARNGAGQGKLRISGDRLDRLGRLFGTALPQLGPYAAGGNIAVSASLVRATEVEASFGRSRLAGEVRVEHRSGQRPRHVAALRVPVLHLEDIGADRWRDDAARVGARPSPTAPTAQRQPSGFERMLQRLRAADLDATVDVEELRGDGVRFASGRLRVTGDDGVLRVRLQQVSAAGGTLDADLRVDAGATPPKFGLRAQARNLEYGPLARAVDPGSTAAGRLDVVADLAAEGQPQELLPTVSGTVDAAVYPRGLHSDGLALWGAGLLGAMLGQLDPKSRAAVECAVASVDLLGGTAKSSALFVDTARVRIVGEFEVDLTTRALSGRIDPVSKEPALLTFAPTMLLGGTVEAPKLTAAAENVVTVPLRLAAPLSGFAPGWLGGRGQGRAAAEGCREAFERIRQARAGAAAPPPR